ncbi:MAG TPA: antibiotic biosynthesis monooxygenase [Solirubrobacteraceae bacterium]|nr:antibiotic biosynthesis monooxygenase [Solirubrobacteraceae bacterium]
MPGGVVHLQWYATGFRGDDLEAALQEIVPMSTRFGATRYLVFRQREDRYRFLMSIEWRDKADWDRFWFSPEFTEMRAACTGWYQVPLLYTWADLVSQGELREPAAVGERQQ